MSRPRSQSPSYRRFPWEERNFDPYKVLAELDGSAMDRSPPPRDRRSYYRESPEGQRRSPPYQDPGGQQRQLDQEEFYRRRPSPHSDTADYGDRRFLPQHDGGSDSGRHRGGFREDFQSFESWRRSSRSPPRLPREKLPPTPKTHLDHSPMLAGTSWRREEQVRGRARFRDLSPGVKSDDQRGAGRERGRKSTHKGQQRDDLHLECPPFKRHRREMDDPEHLGSLCYSSDRQLSLDLVNVGRQRLDFLPMLEHSGTFRETATHTGTFAQEIITLVHQVKELYFRGDGITLNERFSASQKGGFSEDDVEELTLVERLSSSRGCSLNLDSLLDEEQPLVSRLGAMQGLIQQPMRGPGDLRHDLERKRQERLEGVKVTILGNHQPLGPISDPSPEFSDQAEMEDEGFYNWPAEQNRRWEGIEGPRRGDQSRLNSGPQRRNSRSRLGPLRRQNHRNNPAGHQGQNW
ncbi:uncharacterized protein ACBR49_016430 isoform 5-T5 [Aulostomus maculatus]